MSLTGCMVVNITTCGKLSFNMRCFVAAVIIRIIAFIAGYQVIVNMKEDTLYRAFSQSPPGEKFQVDIKEGFGIIEISKANAIR